MTSLALLFTLSAIGISETVYLIRIRIASKKPVCPVGDGCAAVLASKYGRIFIIPNDILGLLAYIAASLVSALLVIGAGMNERNIREQFSVANGAIVGTSIKSGEKIDLYKAICLKKKNQQEFLLAGFVLPPSPYSHDWQ